VRLKLLSTKKRTDRVRIQRKRRVRGKISGSEVRPRLSVFRSARHIYVQAIADDLGRTLAEASTLSKEILDNAVKAKKSEVAKKVGQLVAKRLMEKGISQVVFDRGRFLYHGRVKALADGAREAGLKF
jgi:large subunit ribosomal protein L18